MEISFGDEKHGQQIWVICLLCDLPPNFSPKKILYGLFLDRRLRVQNLMKNLSSFLRTGLMKGACLPEEISDEVRRSLVWDESEFQSMELR